MSSFLVEGFGYLATLLLALSLLVTNDLKFRWLNALGCVAFIVYGILLKAFPIILTNALLLGINVFYLFRIYKRTEDFELVTFGANDPLIEKFLAFYKDDIKAYFPQFDTVDLQNEIRFLVVRDMNIANLFVAELKEGIAEVKLNYTIPKYRDFKVGRFLFEKEKDFLLSMGIRTICYKEVFNKSHLQFLEVNGFQKEAAANSAHIIKHLS